MRTFYFLTAILFFHIPLLMGQNSPVDTSRKACIQQAGILLDEAFSIMQKNYYRKDSVQWQPLISSAKILLGQSSDCEAAYKAVQWCFDQMKEKHSFIMPPVKAAIYTGTGNGLHPGSSSKLLSGPIRHELIDGEIAYISVPWIATTDGAVCTRFADSIQSIIKTFGLKGVEKWIIDLRKNTGGNCWPMLAGLGPLLGNGVHGFFVSSKESIPISYKNGMVMQGKQIRCVLTDPYVAPFSNKTVIILTGPNTSSAGEIVALAFKGLKNVFLYGEPTAGLTTANATYPLSDGSVLVLTVCKEADRTGKIVEGRIQPDELILPSRKGSDNVMESAIMFLQLQ
ncbi:MAG: S41 family peptidase [Chitinophagaceae bacterium]|nr:S41 family peptidase [Chitinophagaceae bacterium]